MSDYPLAPKTVLDSLRKGVAIPAHPLALDAQRKFDERRQRALTRYYLDAGAGGVAVGVHSTQFEIREPDYGLFEPVLTLAAETIDEWEGMRPGQKGAPVIRIAGLCGGTDQAVLEAQLIHDLGYHAGLLSLGAMRGSTLEGLIEHTRAVAREIPIFGFYLQPVAGGILLPYAFWREFLEIPNVAGIKIAPFNRYQTLDVVRAVAESGRAEEVCLYTGNDDHIILDLLSEYAIETSGGTVKVSICGGLLGHWACWTRRAVEQLECCRQARKGQALPASLLTLAGKVTDCNAALFDAANGYAGALSGINEVLRRQGLLEANLCLNERERLSPGQAEEIDRVCAAYPDLNDDDFIRENLDCWLR